MILTTRLLLSVSSRVVGGGAFHPYLPDKDSLQGWVGAVSPGRDAPGLRVAQEALLTPVCDTGYSHVLRGTQPFDRGLGFSRQEAGQHAWERELRRGQVRLTRRPPAASCARRGEHPSLDLLLSDGGCFASHLTSESSSKRP